MVNHLHGCQPVTEMPLIRELLFALSEMSSPRLLMPPLYIEVVARREREGMEEWEWREEGPGALFNLHD